jgi:DNA/RNA endonuclease YhcR with UshA esterase domain
MKNNCIHMGLLLTCILGLSGLVGCQTAGPKVIDASDDAAIQNTLPQNWTVAGTVSSVDASQSVIAIHFAGTDKSGFYAVVLERGMAAVEKVYGDGLKALNGKSISVTGKVTLYRGKPEIIISDPKQIVVAS